MNQTQTDPKVTPLKDTKTKEDKPQKKKKKESDEPKVRLGTVEVFLVDYLTTGKPKLFMPKYLPHERLNAYFHKETPTSVSRILQLDKDAGLAVEIGFEELTSKVSDRLSLFAIEDHPCQVYCLSQTGIVNFAKRLMATGERIPKWPKPCGFKKLEGDEEFYFERHPFLPVRNASLDKFPIIKSFLARTENAVGLCQIIGSLLAGEPIRKLNPLLYGPSGTGKSTFFTILKKCFGKKGWSNVPRTHGDKFASSFVENTGAWFADEVKSEFLRSDTFKNISGADSYPVRKIGRDYVDVPLQGVFFLNCNSERLELPNEDAIIQERLLGCYVDGMIDPSKKIDQKEILERAEEELPYFIGYCLDTYQERGRKVFRTSNSLRDVVSDSEIDIEAIWDRYLIEDLTKIGKDAVVTNKDWVELWEKICAENPAWAREKFQRKEFNKYTARKLGNPYHSQQIWKDGSNQRFIPGVRIK